MDVYKIKQLDALFEKYLGDNKKIIKVQIARLTAAGENYGSLMLSAQISVKNFETKNEETFFTVAKMVPPNNWLQEVFHTPISFKNEIEFYKTIIPTLQKFQLDQQGVESEISDLFPKFYNSRASLLGDKTIDKNAVILLENLKTCGYVTFDRRVGFDMEMALLTLKNLALFHATPMALKLIKPDEFQKKIKPYLTLYPVISSDLRKMVDPVLNILKENSDIIPLLPKITRILLKGRNNSFREPFATIAHCDLWINNVMLKFHDDKAVACKIIDFQTCNYKSFACDLVFFLFTSIKFEVMQQNLDYLIEFYYQHLIGNLKKLKCDVTVFTFEAFLEEIKVEAEDSELFHILFMLNHVFVADGGSKDITELRAEDLFNSEGVPQEHKERAWYVVKEFEKRGWI